MNAKSDKIMEGGGEEEEKRRPQAYDKDNFPISHIFLECKIG
ncbi:MAG TPA: hypothetical protein VF233_02150 [Nitrososphaeraceae archaeon]